MNSIRTVDHYFTIGSPMFHDKPPALRKGRKLFDISYYGFLTII